MNKVTTLAEATSHFENSFDPIICTKDGEAPQEVTSLKAARDYYGFEEGKQEQPAVEPEAAVVESGSPEVENNGEGTSLPPVEQTGN